jgi:RNA polymerase sigma-70 factor, ECF subfamily
MDEQELAETYRRYFPAIRAKCARMLRDPAEAQDLAQETFVRLWAQRDGLRDTDAALAWVYRTATRLAIDRLRHAAVAAQALSCLQGEQDGPARQVEARQTLAEVIGRLQPRELEALILARVDGLTQPEIVQVMQASERSVRRLLQQADARLQRIARRP